MSLQQIVENAYKTLAAARFPIGQGLPNQQPNFSTTKK